MGFYIEIEDETRKSFEGVEEVIRRQREQALMSMMLPPASVMNPKKVIHQVWLNQITENVNKKLTSMFKKKRYRVTWW